MKTRLENQELSKHLNDLHFFGELNATVFTYQQAQQLSQFIATFYSY